MKIKIYLNENMNINYLFVFKDIDDYFIHLLFDHNEIDLLIKISILNRYYNFIIKDLLRDFHKYFFIYKSNFIDSIPFGNLMICKFIYHNYDLVKDHRFQMLFINCCQNNKLDIAKWLYNTGGIDIHSVDNYTFSVDNYTFSIINQNTKNWINSIILQK